jgi:dienelactone hydrolase
VRDAGGKLWHASTTFRADSRGAVDLDRAATRSGSYAGRWGMGLIASLTTKTPSAHRFRWQAADAQTFRIDVRVRGRRVASSTFRRAMPGAVVEKPVSIADSGFYGSYYTRADIAERAPAILLLGGSEGGLPSGPLVTTLAARGFPTLSLAYFGAPGLPPTLANIPLEYFEKALTWLRDQPEVDPSRVVVIGVSRGSEAAQLLGVHYPSLVSAVVASVPSSVALCGYPDCSVPAWTLGGQPVPYTQEFDNPHPSDNPDAVIPDERIRGPLLLVCGGRDLVWFSCPYARAIMSRLASFNHQYRDVLYAYGRAGHFVGGLLPYAPIAPRAFYLYPADEQAREAVWPHLLSFLARL